MGKSGKTRSIHDEFEDARQSVEGHVDDGHVTINCSNCRVPLVDVWVTKPELKVANFLTVDCPHCGDKSFEVTVKGGFYLGITENTEMSNTEMGDMVLDEGVYKHKVVIRTIKGKKAWEHQK